MTKAERLSDYKQARKHPKGPVKRLYSIPEAAFYLGRTVDALREMIWAGKLQIVRDGKRILLDVRDMDTFIEQNKSRFTY
jgi:excisionase family DNA binding protein